MDMSREGSLGKMGEQHCEEKILDLVLDVLALQSVPGEMMVG